ncbi:MAG: PHP domain-containing protein [archaeon]
MKMKLDLHMHTRHSPDGFMEILEIIQRAKSVGLSGVAITDHNCVDALPLALKAGKEEDFLVIPGVEVKSRHGDILGLGITSVVPRGLPAAETVRRIHKLGGIAVAAHPYSVIFHPNGVRGEVRTAGFDAVEVFNSRTYFSNRMGYDAAKRAGIPMTASSDAHLVGEIGNSYTVVDCRKDADSVLSEIREGRTEIVCRLTPLLSIMSWYWQRLRRVF